MDELLDRIHSAKGLDDLLPLIDHLSRETEALASRKVLLDSDFDRILRPIAIIRMLLGKLDLLAPGPEHDPHVMIIRDLAARCMDLEGTLKEARNDRSRAGKVT